MKGDIVVNNDILLKRNKELRQKYTSCLIKWYQTTMTKEEKYKFGFMTQEEYVQWQAELEAEALLKELAAEQGDTAVEGEEYGYHTFWENDEGDRSNISQDSYAEFLLQNSIDVSNSTRVDIDALLADENNGES